MKKFSKHTLEQIVVRLGKVARLQAEGSTASVAACPNDVLALDFQFDSDGDKTRKTLKPTGTHNQTTPEGRVCVLMSINGKSISVNGGAFTWTQTIYNW